LKASASGTGSAGSRLSAPLGGGSLALSRGSGHARVLLVAQGRSVAGSPGIVCGVPQQLDLTIVYEPGEDGWVVASIPEVAGVFSQGRTRGEARANVIDALRLMLSPEPTESDDNREREQLHLTIAA